MMKNISIMRDGPYGGKGGGSWDDGVHTTVRQLIIFHSSVIESIQVEYDENGRSEWSEAHGSKRGSRTVIKLEYPDEFLVSVSGHHSEFEDGVVGSLTIESNKRTYGPIGKERGHLFKFTPTDAKIVGFHGKCGHNLDSIGTYFEPIANPSHWLCEGPFGGQGGSSWDDGVHSTIRQLIIFSSSSLIESIQIEYDEKGRSEWSDTHGSRCGTRNTVKLDYPGEFLLSVEGYYTDSDFIVLRSLSFESNKRKYGPFGAGRGNYFKFPSDSAKIIGFHGKSGHNLDSIGAYFEPIPDTSYWTSEGPFGGKGGSPWDDGNYTTVRQLIIFSASIIESIQIEYDKKGRSEWSETHGSKRGTRNMVKLDYPGEFLLSVSGYCTESEPILVRSLTIISNKRTYGPFGKEKGDYFECPSTSGKIIGFHGRSGDNLDSIGVIFEPFPKS